MSKLVWGFGAGLFILGAIAACSSDDTPATATTGDTAGTAGAGGTGGAGGGFGGLPNARDCLECLTPLAETDGACEDKYATCEDDEECDKWLGCIEACAIANFQKSCFNKCDEDNAQIADQIEDLVGCFCPACGDVCSPLCDRP